MPEASYGTLYGRLRCADNFLTPYIGIRRLDAENKTFKLFDILSDGTYEEPLNPGRYEACLFNERLEQDGNGGQPECSYFNINVRKVSQTERELLGHAYTSSSEPVPEVSSGCHTHRLWIFGHFQYFESHPHWRWVSGHWFTWKCCCDHPN